MKPEDRIKEDLKCLKVSDQTREFIEGYCRGLAHAVRQDERNSHKKVERPCDTSSAQLDMMDRVGRGKK